MKAKSSYDPRIHHRRSIRLKNYDYSKAGLYFVTLCCQDRARLFGHVEDGCMILNEAGKVAEQCRLEIPNHYPKVVLHDFVIMPNHVHGIIELVDEITDGAEFSIGGSDLVGAENFLPQRDPNPVPNSVPKPQRHEFQKIIPRSLGSIIRGYKIGVTKWMRRNTDVHDVWQRNYYERIIRNGQAYYAISNYILNNPAKWERDRFYNA
jgi:putative transposase